MNTYSVSPASDEPIFANSNAGAKSSKRGARKHPDTDELEHHPALLALLRDVQSGTPVGIINIYLAADGRDRICAREGKTVCGRAIGMAVMLSDFVSPAPG